MKLFWAIIAAIVVAAGATVLMRGRGDAPAGVRESAMTTPDPGAGSPAQAEPLAPMPAEAPTPSAVETESGPEPGKAAVDSVNPPVDVAPEEAESNAAAEAGEQSKANELTETDESAEADGPSEEDDSFAYSEDAEAETADAADVSESDAPSPTGEAPAELASDAPGAPLPDEPAPPEAAPAAVVGEDGVLVLDGRYRVPGEGTAEKPYQIDWDMLIAVEQQYSPREEGKKEVPAWIKPLDGKHVAITGFIAFPFIAPSADECMVMLNPSDGCCVGVPPTPYDAVEVKLAEAIDLQGGIVNYGTLTGVFRTDPYLVNNWLIGLYVMDDASITQTTGNRQSGF